MEGEGGNRAFLYFDGEKEGDYRSKFMQHSLLLVR